MSEKTIETTPPANDGDGEKTPNVVDKPQEESVKAPPEGSSRWNELYGQKKRLERQMDGQTELITAIREDNRRLREEFGSVKQDSINRTAVTAIESLEVRKTQAMRDEDYDTVNQIDRDIRKEENKKLKAEWEAEQTVKTPPPTERPLDPATQKFLTENPWANPAPENQEFNEKMFRYARTLDGDLEVQYPAMSIAARLQKVKEETEAVFNGKPAAAPAPTVEGGGEHYDAPGEKNVRLTNEQIAIAKTSFPDLNAAEAQKEYIKFMK